MIMKFTPKTTFIFLTIFLLALTLAHATRPGPTEPESKPKGGHHHHHDNGGGGGGGGGGDDVGGYFGPGGGFGIPGFGQGWGPGVTGGGYGYGYGSPSGGHSKGGTIRPSIVCKDKSTPCYMKKLRCPAKCFTSYSRSGKGYGGGGGGGGCTMDCQKSCTAYC